MVQDRKRIYLRYDTQKENRKKNLKIEVIYLSKDSISEDNYKILCKQFKDYLNSLENGDIVEVTSSIKNMLKDFDESKLEINISDDNKYQTVEYVDGYMDFCHLSYKDWDDIVSVIDSKRVIDVHYKKFRKHFNSDETISNISEELLEMMNKVYELRKMEKKKENIKIKKL